MRSNLPAPSQAWGNDIERRVASMESQLMLLSNNYSTTRGQVEGLTAARSVSGVAIPWQAEQTVYNPNDGRGIAERTRVITEFLDWKDRGNLMSVFAVFMVDIPNIDDKEVGNFDWTKFESPRVFMGIATLDGNDLNKREIVYPLTGLAIKGKNFWVTSVSMAEVLDYETYEKAYIYVDLRGTPSEPRFLNTGKPGAYVKLHTTATIF